jgi:hypothetical protein
VEQLWPEERSHGTFGAPPRDSRENIRPERGDEMRNYPSGTSPVTCSQCDGCGY